MADKAKLLALAERCEQATADELDDFNEGGVPLWRCLDRAIDEATRSPLPELGYWAARQLGELPAFTTSLDAAMTLADGYGGQVSFYKDGTGKAFLWQPYPLAIEAKAATPALALCAAALRAQATITGDGE